MVAEAWCKEEILVMLCWITILGGVLIMTDNILARKRCGRCAKKSAMHQVTAGVFCHSHARTATATCQRPGQYTCLRIRTTGKKEGGGTVRGTQESDRTPLPALAEITICSRAALRAAAQSATQS